MVKCMDIGNRRLLTMNEAAKVARVSRRTMYNWIYAGRLETVRLFNGKLRIFADSLFLQAREKTLSR